MPTLAPAPAPTRVVTVAGVAAGVFIAVAVAHLALRIAGADDVTIRVSQGLLMPALALWALSPLSRPGGLSRRVAVPLTIALACSWIGDLAPGFLAGDAGFLAMVGAFFVAQLAWIVTLWPWRRSSVAVGRRRPLLFAYAAAAVVVLALSAPGAGVLLAAIVPYAAVLAVTAVLATALGWRGCVGGLLFMASDAMIAVFSFAPVLDPGTLARGLAVMSTYCAAQGLLVAGVRRAEARRSPA